MSSEKEQVLEFWSSGSTAMCGMTGAGKREAEEAWEPPTTSQPSPVRR